MDVADFDRLSDAEAAAALLACCGSRLWAARMARRRPFTDRQQLLAAAEEVWWQLTPADWLETFAAHPRIGERTAGEDAAARWSTTEQAGAAAAADDVKEAIAVGNRRYEERFGHVFLIAAAGRSGTEILAALERRLDNEPESELREAAAEQAAITRQRLDRLLDG